MAIRRICSVAHPKQIILTFNVGSVRFAPESASELYRRLCKPAQSGLGRKQNMRYINQFIVVILISSACVYAQDWPQWRGPNRDGKVSGFNAPENWPEKLTSKWTKTVGRGDASPALVGDKLYVFTRQGEDEVVLCLNADSGDIIWERKYPAEFIVTGPAKDHGGPRSTPAIADGKICTLGIGGILSCFDAADGNVLWRKQSDSDFLGTAYKFDTTMSPVIVDDKCIVHLGGENKGAILAFDTKTGEPKWKWEGDAPAFSSPVLMTVDGVKQIVTFTQKKLIGLSLSDGTLLWEKPFEAEQGNKTTPAVDGRTVFFTGQRRGLFAVKIEKQAEGFVVNELWSNDQLGASFTTPVLKDGLLFGYTKGLFCADAKTGINLWSDTTNRGRSASLLDGGSCMLALCNNCDLIAFKTDNRQYEEIAGFKVAETEIWAHPVIAGNRIYIKDKESLAMWVLE